MDIFNVVHLSKLKLCDQGGCALYEMVRACLLESTAGLNSYRAHKETCAGGWGEGLEQPEVEGTDVLAPTYCAVYQVQLWSPQARRNKRWFFRGLLMSRAESGLERTFVEFDMVTAQQAALVAQLRARFSSERSQSVQKDEEILLLKTQLADAQAEAESSRSYAQKLAEEKMALFVKVEQERVNSADYKAGCHWVVKYLEGCKNNHFAGLNEFRQRVEELLEKQEEKLRKLSIEYDEELYPQCWTMAECRWLISHGLRLAAMSALESQEAKQSFGDVVKYALARGKAKAVEELHEKKLFLLTVAMSQVGLFGSVTRINPIDVLMAWVFGVTWIGIATRR
ncbi:hypothetical protein Tco_1004387 [Tanacetum coccineum]|uniref:Uncharacterized protein n=1 Tax=Tanacetum coccineum TaxID=301880 RepID=A0ABQ5FCE1_9ASTR